MQPDIFLLDTDICSYLMKHRHSVVQERLRRTPPESVAASAVTLGEIWFGLAWRKMGLKRHMAAESFFQSMIVLEWPAAASPIYGHLRAKLTQSGLDIGRNDVMIAAHAIFSTPLSSPTIPATSAGFPASSTKTGLDKSRHPTSPGINRHTSSGSASHASGVATSSTRYPFHSPPPPRNVASPLSAEIPAPVRQNTRSCVCGNLRRHAVKPNG